MDWFRKLIFGGGRASVTVSFGLLILRLWTGLTIALFYGRAKGFPPPPGFVEGVRQMGFPLPEVSAWLAVMAELFGGLLLALGLMTRPAAFFVAFTMAVAVTTKLDLNIASPDRMNPQHYLVACVVLLFTGSGRYGVDAFLRPKSRTYGMSAG